MKFVNGIRRRFEIVVGIFSGDFFCYVMIEWWNWCSVIEIDRRNFVYVVLLEELMDVWNFV